MWEAVCLTLAATAGNNIGKVLQKKGTVSLPPLSFKLKACLFLPFCPSFRFLVFAFNFAILIRPTQSKLSILDMVSQNMLIDFLEADSLFYFFSLICVCVGVKGICIE